MHKPQAKIFPNPKILFTVHAGGSESHINIKCQAVLIVICFCFEKADNPLVKDVWKLLQGEQQNVYSLTFQACLACTLFHRVPKSKCFCVLWMFENKQGQYKPLRVCCKSGGIILYNQLSVTARRLVGTSS